jgi:hypothetical protein
MYYLYCIKKTISVIFFPSPKVGGGVDEESALMCQIKEGEERAFEHSIKLNIQ